MVPCVAMTSTKGPGRPRKGPGGVAVRALPPLTVRLPLPALARLKALAVLQGSSPSEVITEVLNTAFERVPTEDTRTLGALARREAERLRERYPDAE